MALPFVGVGDIFLVNGRTSINAQLGEFGCHFKVTSFTGASVTIQEIGNAYATDFDAALPNLLGVPVRVENPYAALIEPADGTVLVSAFGVSAHPAGTSGPNTIPTQVAAVLKKTTVRSGVRYRGRMYLPFLCTVLINANGELNAAGLAAIRAFILTMYPAVRTVVGAGGTADVKPVLLHRLPLPQTTTDIDVIDPTSKLGTQVRRGDYGRRNII